MKMSDINHLLPTRLRHLSLSLVAVAGMASCDSVIYDDEGDCSVHYRISFRYVKNMLGADAFGPQVTDINLQVYDQHGKLVLSKSEKRNPTEANDFLMEVDLQPGTYDLLAWCEGESLNPDATRFSISGGGEGNLTGCSASLPLSGSGSDLYSDRDITRLYHGFADDVVFPDTYGQVDIAPLYLTKDTNHITVLIQNLDGSGIDETDLSISLEADNSVIEWNNDVAGAPAFVYRPWWQQSTVISPGEDTGVAPDSRTSGLASGGEYHGLMAELTTSRLLSDREQYLTVKKTETGETLIRIPLIQYLLLVKGKYPGVKTDQDYLDAYDDFTMMFFMSDDQTWLKSRVIINGWRIVPPQDTEL